MRQHKRIKDRALETELIDLLFIKVRSDSMAIACTSMIGSVNPEIIIETKASVHYHTIVGQ